LYGPLARPIRDVDDHAFPARAHRAAERPRQQERRLQVHVDARVPDRFVDRVERRPEIVRRAVDEHGHSRRSVLRLVGEPAYLRDVREIRLDDVRVDAERAQVGHRRPGFVGRRVVVHDDVRAAPRELERDDAPDPSRGARDERPPAAELHAGPLSNSSGGRYASPRTCAQTMPRYTYWRPATVVSRPAA
jgi:hypothetical protein